MLIAPRLTVLLSLSCRSCSPLWCRPFSDCGVKIFTEKQQRTRRREVAQVERTVASLERRLKRGNDSVAHKIVNTFPFCSARPLLFKKLISVLLENHRWSDAFSIYRRMLAEDILPAPWLYSKMTAVVMLDAAMGVPDTVSTFKRFLFLGASDDAWFRQTVEILAADSYDPDLVQQLIEMYLASRKWNWHPTHDFAVVMAELQARGWEQWRKVKRKIRARRKSVRKMPPSQLAEVYASVLTDAPNPCNDTPEARAQLVQRMTQLEVPLTPDAMNAFIRLDVANGETDHAFLSYHALMANRSRTMLPDAHTYRLLFNLAAKIYSKTNRKHKATANTLSPLALFQGMIECHLIQTMGRMENRSSVISVPALNAAIRAFLKQEDYLGAYIVASMFQRCQLRPNFGTYGCVLGHLKASVGKAVRSKRNSEWVTQLLAIGQPYSGRGWTMSSPTSQLDPTMSFGDHIMMRLLWLASGSHMPMHTEEARTAFIVDPERVLLRHSRVPRRLHFRFPPLSTLIGGSMRAAASYPANNEETFESVPLLRILRRAITPKSGRGRALVTQLIKEAQDKMIVNLKDLGFARGKHDKRRR